MRQFLVLAVFAATLSPVPSLGLEGFSLSSLPSSRSFDFHELCEWFCRDHDYDFWFRTLDKSVSPRFFCGLCDKKHSTTTTTTQPTSTTTTTMSTTTTSPSTTSTPTTMSSSQTESTTVTGSTQNVTSSTEQTSTPGMG